MPPRLGYRKSRNGCERCKERRVKCDEKTPCAACIRHHVTCSLTTADGSDGNSVALTQPRKAVKKATLVPRRRYQQLQPTQLRNIGSGATPCKLDPFPYLSNLFSVAGTPDSLAWDDLELMHHFTATTWQTLPQGYKRQEVWQIEVPRLALQHDFLMYQLLAISAFHLAYIHDERRTDFVIRASHHQNLAISGLRSVLPDLTEGNCHAIFAVASLLSIGAFASSSDRLTQPGQPTVDTLLEVFLLIRGMHHILKNYESLIADGPIGSILRFNAYQSDSAFLAEIVQELQCLMASWDEDQGDAPSRECRASAALLVDWIKSATSSAEDPELRVTMTWCLDLTETFMELLRQQVRQAVDLLRLYCRIVEAVGSRNWYLAGWGASIIASART